VADLLLNNIAGSIGLFPFTEIQIRDNGSNPADFITISHLEEESNYQIDSITKQDQYGNNRILAYRFNFSAYVPHNHNWKLSGASSQANLLYKLENLSSNIRVGLLLGWSTSASQDVAKKVYNTTGQLQATIEGEIKLVTTIESVRLRPRLIISGTKILTTNQVFT
jgi:hypothetical protein